MAQLMEKARKGYILYLKHSGERIADLRSLPIEELREWYTSVRDINEREAKRQRELIENMRKERSRRR